MFIINVWIRIGKTIPLAYKKYPHDTAKMKRHHASLPCTLGLLELHCERIGSSGFEFAKWIGTEIAIAWYWRLTQRKSYSLPSKRILH